MEALDVLEWRSAPHAAPVRSLLAVGVPEADLPALRRAALEADLGFTQAPTTVSGAAWLEKVKPSAVLVDLRALVACDIFSTLRRMPEWADVPLIGLSTELNEVMFAETLRAGGDDVVRPCDTAQLARRLRAARPRGGAPVVPFARGRAVVAGMLPAFRMVASRVLQGAGYDVDTVLATAELERAMRDDRIRLVVTSDDLPEGDAVSILEAARAAGREVPFVISVAPRQAARTRIRTRKMRGVALCDPAAGPDELLFAANELLFSPQKSRRSSERLPYGTGVWIRPAGTAEDVVGFSYNVSAGGLFVRTLHPFAPGDTVWIEVVPPRSERRVRLSAQVTWHRPFGHLGPALTPPGSGFQITGGLPGELEIWEKGVQELGRSSLQA